jgi:uncharacterized protein
MHLDGSSLTLSATDLAHFLACRHRTALEMAVAYGERKRPFVEDPLLELLWKRGADHEKRYVDELRDRGGRVEEIAPEVRNAERLARTRDLMRDGVDVIVQGALADGPWFGKPDIMRRIERPSILGGWSYEIADAKLARETRAGTIMQLELYSELLTVAQGLRPEHFYVVTPETFDSPQTYRVDDYAAYFRLVRDQLLATVERAWEDVAGDNYPDRVDHCDICPWSPECRETRRADDHLSLVAGISRTQRRELDDRAIGTVAALASMPVPLSFKPRHGSRASYERVREQARLQVDSRGRTPPLHQLLAVEPDKGLCRLPEPTPGDLFLDLEHDEFATETGGREYLIGIARADGSYEARWAFTDHDERSAFEWAMDTIEEALYSFERTTPLADADRSLRAMEYALETGRPGDVSAEARAAIEGYNRDDCVSALRLRDWLEQARATLVAAGTDVPRASLAVGEPPPKVDDRARAVEALRARLLSGIPEARAERNDEQQAWWLLAYLLDFHRREDKAVWWDFFRLCALPEEELLDEREAVAGLEFVERIEVKKRKKSGKPTGSVVDRYRYPPQEIEIDAGDELTLPLDKKAFGTVVALDRAERTIDIFKGPSRAATHPTAVFEFWHVSSDAMERSLMRIAEDVANGGSKYRAARALLVGEGPRLKTMSLQLRKDEREAAFAVRIAGDLDETVLAIQGPPGAGKTYTGARMICALVDKGLKVGIAATSHQVIDKLLSDVHAAALETGTPVRLAHKIDEKDGSSPDAPIATLAEYDDVVDALAKGDANVVGGTSWLWSREELANAVEVLFVDEAGQMALANVVAISQAAKSVVLLGDPQQLEQPRRGTHPDGVSLSSLEHVLRGERTIPPDRGIFLPVTWRLPPRICDFTSEVFYDSRLHTREAASAQRITGAPGLCESGLQFIPVEHDGNRNHSADEAEAVADLIARLTAPGVTWRDANGVECQMTPPDVLVVAPYNAQVSRVLERLRGTGVRAGTVDKFQGQEAPVVIYTMATSRPEDAPRGMEFLYNLNRLNVATSRARCLSILVASPRLLEPECRSPRQMKLANALCRFREMAD